MEPSVTGLDAILAAFDLTSVSGFVEAGALVGITITIIFLGWRLSNRLSKKM